MTPPTFQELLTSQEARFTNKQLEVWAGLGPWHVEQEINIENEFDDPDGDVYVCHPKTTCETTTVCHLTWNCTHKHGPERQTNAALIAAAPALAAALLAERKAREVEVGELKRALSYAIQAIDGEIPNLDERMCCNGHECSCYGSTNRCLLLHDLRQSLKGQRDEV